MQGIPQDQNSGNQGSHSGSQKPSLSWQSPSANTPTKPSPATEKPKAPTPAQTAKAADKMNQNSNQDRTNMATYVGIFVAGLIIGILLGWGIASGRSGTSGTATTTPNGTSTTGTSMTDGDSMMAAGGLTVAASQPAGSSVAVSNITVSKPTWVVVYDDNNGVAGHALGASLFLPTASGGETSGSIDLLRPTVSGTSYLVGQVVDDGDYNLSFTKDMAVLDASGKQAFTVITVN